MVKAINSDLLTKYCKAIKHGVFRSDKQERRVWTVSEAELFLGKVQTLQEVLIKWSSTSRNL